MVSFLVTKLQSVSSSVALLEVMSLYYLIESFYEVDKLTLFYGSKSRSKFKDFIYFDYKRFNTIIS